VNIEPTAPFDDETLAIVRQLRAAVESGDEPRVYDIARSALGRGVRHPTLLHAHATWLWHQGLFYQALVDLEAALEFSPRNPMLLNEIGECLLKLGVWSSARKAFDSAIASAPLLARSHYGRGLALQMSGEREAAMGAHMRAVELKPDHAKALGSLALISVGHGKPDSVRHFAGRALSLEPSQPTAQIALATAELNAGNFEVAEKRTREILRISSFGEDPRANDALRELGDSFHRIGNVPLAFDIYSAVNRKRREIHGRRFANTRASILVALQHCYFMRSAAWKPSPGPRLREDAPAGHVFVLGFARSGTTLIEAILASNDRVVALDEKDCFPDSAKALLESADGMDRLSAPDDPGLALFREAYWERVSQFAGPVAGKIFVDKWPLNSRRLPLISRLFPDARILLSLRDPRDVVLSCFRRSFVMNPDTFEFLELKDCARFYSDVMNLALCVREKLPLRLHEVRYEDLVTDFDSTVRAVCGFIGADWNETMRDFARMADVAIDANAQSRAQLRRGLYSGGMGQWRRYQDQLAPILPILEPWIERFGYERE
jgi:tetratricopeptide (TPR) repeat protein